MQMYAEYVCFSYFSQHKHNKWIAIKFSVTYASGLPVVMLVLADKFCSILIVVPF